MSLNGFTSRKELGWGATPAAVSNTTLGMIAHYDGSKGFLAKWRAHGHKACIEYWNNTRSAHIHGNGWLDVGYAYFVCPDDEILAGREYGHQQAAELPTAGKLQGGNSRYIAVTFATGPGEVPEPGQIKAWKRLRAWYREEKHGGSAVHGHRDFTGTDCPGDIIYSLVRTGSLSSPASTTPPSKPPVVTPTKPPITPPKDVDMKAGPEYASFGSSAVGATELPPGVWTPVLFDTEYADPTNVHPSGANPSIVKGAPTVYALEFGGEIVGANVGDLVEVDAAEFLYDGAQRPPVDVLKESGKQTAANLTGSLTVHHSAVGWLQKDRKLRVRVRSHANGEVKIVNARVSVAFWE